MPLRKPKPVQIPTPFSDPEKSGDDSVRQRAIWMKLEMQEDTRYSWNRPREKLLWRLIHLPLHKLVSGIVALLLGMGITGGFLFFMDSGITIPQNIIFMESWSSDRTAEDAIRDREAAMEKLRQRVEANRRAYEQQQAREQALEAERRAARQASS